MSIESAFIDVTILRRIAHRDMGYRHGLWTTVSRELVYPMLKGILHDVSEDQVMQVECVPDALKADRVLIRRKR